MKMRQQESVADAEQKEMSESLRSTVQALTEVKEETRLPKEKLQQKCKCPVCPIFRENDAEKVAISVNETGEGKGVLEYNEMKHHLDAEEYTVYSQYKAFLLILPLDQIVQ